MEKILLCFFTSVQLKAVQVATSTVTDNCYIDTHNKEI